MSSEREHSFIRICRTARVAEERTALAKNLLLFLEKDSFFKELYTLIQDYEVPDKLFSWIKPLLNTELLNKDGDHRFEVVKAMIEAALMAQKAKKDTASLNANDKKIEDAIKKLDNPYTKEPNQSWFIGCLYSFFTPLQKEPQVVIPVALYQPEREEGPAAGFVGTLELDILPYGHGLAQHPCDTMEIGFNGFDESFYDSMTYAWKAAEEEAAKKKAGLQESQWGRWRLLVNGKPKSVQSTSASGAAAVGWYHTLTGTQPDPGVIVIAQIDQQGHIIGVSDKSIPQKVEAIIEENKKRKARRLPRLDMIVVASNTNQEHAEKVLKTLGDSYCHVENLTRPRLPPVLKV